MIRIGLSKRQKENLVKEYLKEHEIDKVFVLYAKELDQALNFGVEYEKIEYDEWEMYRTFYPMIEKVDGKTLMIVNDALRTTKYQDLKVNCATVWMNQTPHRIIFNHLPFIEDKEDFRILQKLDQGSKWVKEFDYVDLATEDVKAVKTKISIEVINVETTDKEKESYEKLKNKLADEIENSVNKSPNNLPRRLALKAGDYKKKYLDDSNFYLARNQRFKLDNVDSINSYDPKKKYIFVDLPTSKKELIDFLINTKTKKIKFISTDLSIDNYMVVELKKWIARLEAFYGQASIYK